MKGCSAALVVAGGGNGGPEVDAGDKDTEARGAAEVIGARSMAVKNFCLREGKKIILKNIGCDTMYKCGE